MAAANKTSTAVIAIAARPWLCEAGNLALRIPTADTTSAQATSSPAAMKNAVLLRSWNVVAAVIRCSTRASLTDDGAGVKHRQLGRRPAGPARSEAQLDPCDRVIEVPSADESAVAQHRGKCMLADREFDRKRLTPALRCLARGVSKQQRPEPEPAQRLLNGADEVAVVKPGGITGGLLIAGDQRDRQMPDGQVASPWIAVAQRLERGGILRRRGAQIHRPAISQRSHGAAP